MTRVREWKRQIFGASIRDRLWVSRPEAKLGITLPGSLSSAKAEQVIAGRSRRTIPVDRNHIQVRAQGRWQPGGVGDCMRDKSGRSFVGEKTSRVSTLGAQT